MSAITIPNTLPAELIVLSAELIERIDALVFKAQDLVISDYNSTKPADALHKEMRALVKEIEAGRKTLTAPLDAIKAAAIEAERMGTNPLNASITAIATRIKTAIDAHNAELEKKRQEAEKERQRLQKIEDDRAEAERQALIKQAELDAPPGEEPAPISVLVAPPVMIAAPYVPKSVKSSAIRAATTYELEYTDKEKVPAFSSLGHELRTIDETALKSFLKSLPEGRQEIPGAVRLIKINGTAAK